MGGVNFVLHAAGWLEGGLAIGYEKFVLDCDQLGHDGDVRQGHRHDARTARRSTRSASTTPGQHFLGTAHTLANFETAFYRSTTADNNSYEQWSEEGGLDAAQRANAVWKEQLASYEAPPIDDAVDAELREFVARRKAELPDQFV